MFGNNLNATIAKVQGFIKDLEEGVESNKKAIEANDGKVATISAKESEQIKKIKNTAALDRTGVLNKSTALRDQNRVAEKLLSNLQ